MQLGQFIKNLIWIKWVKKMKKFNVAIVGATGAVGEEMRLVLEERKFQLKS